MWRWRLPRSSNACAGGAFRTGGLFCCPAAGSANATLIQTASYHQHQQQQQQGPRKCFKCGQVGHMSRECPTNTNRGGGHQQQQQHRGQQSQYQQQQQYQQQRQGPGSQHQQHNRVQHIEEGELLPQLIPTLPVVASETSESAAAATTAAVASPTPQSLGKYLLELAYRSAYAREKLKEKICEPSTEIALRQLKDFVSLYKWPQEELEAMVKLSDVERLELLFDIFGKWFFAMRAPTVVKMEQPWDWFPKARSMRRRVIFHLGPTNSGKTHDALEALMGAKSGVYCAPLKALAAQVWKKIDAKVPCDLVIGDERRFGGAAEHVSCTMEMTPVNMMVDVAVIDEIQLIADKDRGWAWTRALLGLPAKELHLCGEARALEVVKKMLWQTKEAGKLEVREHKRLVPLSLAEPLRGRLNSLQNGDCLVVFSRKGIFDYKRRIESECDNSSVHIIYGGLPFDCRENEANAFNDGVKATAKASAAAAGQKKHILVSTDAIAYGLNMNVRRIIFASIKKFNGKTMESLPATTVLQVGGRAGRFGLAFSSHGYTTTLHDRDSGHISQSFAAKPTPISAVGLLPTADILTVYAELHSEKNLTFCELMSQFVEEASAPALFFVCDMARSLLKIAKAIDSVDGVPLRDKILFCYVPLSDNNESSIELLKTWASMHAEYIKSTTAAATLQGTPESSSEELQCDESMVGTDGELPLPGRHQEESPSAFAVAPPSTPCPLSHPVPCVRLLLDEKFESLTASADAEATSKNGSTLLQLESIYRMTEVYCWLAWRFPNSFTQLEQGKELKDKVVAAIQQEVDRTNPSRERYDRKTTVSLTSLEDEKEVVVPHSAAAIPQQNVPFKVVRSLMDGRMPIEGKGPSSSKA